MRGHIDSWIFGLDEIDNLFGGGGGNRSNLKIKYGVFR